MTRSTAFIAELRHAADRVATLDLGERAQLLERAAATIQELRERFGYLGAPVRNQAGDIVLNLTNMARAPSAAPAQEAKELLLEAARIVEELSQLLSDPDRDLERDDD